MKRLFLCFAVAFFSIGLAEPFVWQDAWSVDAAEIQALIAEAGELPEMTLQDAVISGPRTFNLFVSTESNTVVDIEQALGAKLLLLPPR